MPTYEFRCPDGHTFDRFYRKMSDAVAEVPCPECGKTATRQLTGGAGLVFKGSGFYLTDYGKNAHRGDSAGDRAVNAAAKASAESGSGGGDAKSGDAKSGDAKGGESKPSESKSETKSSEPKSAPKESKSQDSKSGDAKAGSPAPSSSSTKTDK